MGDETKIQWTDHTFNPWLGCEKVSAGCKNCYAENDTPVRVHRGKGLELWGGDAARVVTGADNWKKPARWNREAEAEGRRHRVFCASLADVFEDRRDLDAPRARLFALIEQTPWLDWQLVTKRPENMVRLAPASWAEMWPLNVWAMTTVEDQRAADERIPRLLRVPAMVRGLSMEPLLEAVDLAALVACAECAGEGVCNYDLCGTFTECESCGGAGTGIHWVIVGGESGPKARPFCLAWARSIVRQCSEADVPVFVKQLGAFPVVGDDGVPWSGGRLPLHDSHGGNPEEWPSDLRIRQFPTVTA